MNWSYVLSQYPKSLLSSELPSLILATLEREGLSNEEELVKKFEHIESDKVHNTLFDLKMNRLIEYGKHHVRITDRGKQFLEQLDLDDTIIEDILDNLRIDEGIKDSYQKILQDYRKESFTFYLNSLSSMNEWELILKLLPKKDFATISLLPFFILVGQFAIILRDLRNWWGHAGKHNLLKSELNIKLINLLERSALDLNETDILSTFSKSLTFDTKSRKELSNETIIFLTACNSNDSGRRIDFLKHNLKNEINFEIANTFCVLHEYQQVNKPVYWIDTWNPIKESLPNERKYLHAANYLKKVSRRLDKEVKKISLQNSSNTEVSYWNISDFHKPNDINLFELFMACEDFDQLANISGFEPDILIKFLTTMRDKSNSLLKQGQKVRD